MLDRGIDISHPDLTNNILSPYDAFSDDDSKALLTKKLNKQYDKIGLRQKEQWEQAIILINAFNGAIENIWKPFVPGTDEFKPSPKYLHEIKDLIGPSFKSIEASINLDPFSKLSPERRRELTGRQLAINLDKWEFVFQ